MRAQEGVFLCARKELDLCGVKFRDTSNRLRFFI